MDSNFPVSILSFYSFVSIKDLDFLLAKILYLGKRKLVRGTILISNEGINGTISGTKENVEYLLNKIKNLILPKTIIQKMHYHTLHPFQRLKVKIKNEIISMKIQDLNIEKYRGIYVDSINWDSFIQSNDVITIDTRNNYETKIGTFIKALDPNIKTFKEFPNWVRDNLESFRNKKVAMFCTGGIRCEKSTTYLRQLGFKEVYHLKGGILQYLEETNNKNRLWKGKCFVFDDRKTLKDDLLPV